MEMHIAEKEKLSFIRGNSQPPTEKDDGYEQWYADNQKVKRWLLMSMSLEIMKRYIRLPTTRDIWKALSKAFYYGADELQVFTLNQRAFSSKHDGRPLSVYYGELTEIFSELDHRDKVIMESETDVASYQKSVQQQRVHIFLAGLDGEFEQIRGEILRKDPIPELEECYALVHREYVRRTTMNGEPENSEASAMVTRNRSNQNWPSQHHRDPRKRNSKKTSTAAVVETKTEGDVAEKVSALAIAAGNGGKGEYQEHVQTLDYDDVHISEEGELSKLGNRDAGNFDTSDIDLAASCDEHPETEVVAPPLSKSLNEHPETEVVAPPQATDTLNQFLSEDVPDLVSEPSKKQLPPRHTREIYVRDIA
ncbi:hypothetical protein MRB53_011243 [Persea americana]|uniref:Uncharacterized protein n=1 Tax=Persea americana TaxID=3435 RepID=A0ACC2LUB9_PERAE|nr:hypothetical protein MRB53_011243 [Persea americana]